MAKPIIIADILRARLVSLGVAKRIKEASVEQVWPELVGSEIAAHTRVIRIERGHLLVGVDSAPWRQELMYQREALLTKLNQALCDEGGAPVVIEIKFTGP